ncbi:hypothetical protein ACLB2K_060032 [Fragaria x ananassa]
MDPLHLFRIIFANGQTLLPSQDQALFGELASASSAPTLTSIANQEPVQDDEVHRRRNTTPADEDVTVLDHDPEEDDHITLNELLHNILPVCHAAPITIMDDSGRRVPFDPIGEIKGDPRTEASNAPEEVNDAQQQAETAVEEGGSLILLTNASSPDCDNVPPVATPTPVFVYEDITVAHIESDEPRATAAAEEKDMGENLAPQATKEIDLETSDADAAAEATSVKAEAISVNSEIPNTICSDPPTVSSSQTSMEVALMDALEMPSLALEVVAAIDLLSNLEQIDLVEEECMPQISKAITTLRSCANESEMKHLEDL